MFLYFFHYRSASGPTVSQEVQNQPFKKPWFVPFYVFTNIYITFICLLQYFVTWFESVSLLNNKNRTLSCPSNSFVGHLADCRFNDSEAVE